MKVIVSFVFCFSIILNTSLGQKPFRIGIVGLSHSHVLPLLRNLSRTDIQIVGIAESNSELLYRYAKEYSLDKNILFESMDKMLEKTKPEGVVTFTSIFDHLRVVEACAPRGIHVMVEKPLAVSIKHVEAMSKLVRKYGIQLLTNYETSWYPSNYKGYEMVNQGELGKLRKIIVYDGHKGPKEINVNSEFLDWLTDPVLNGGGAVTDFGCYGADLITWIMKGEKPVSVFAQLKQYKPEVYPKVDDDATILLSYPTMEGVINASWNWPFSRKDMHIYGTTGQIFCDDAETIRYRLNEITPESTRKLLPTDAPFNDPFTFFAAAVKGRTIVKATDLSSFEINKVVVEILEAARKSNKSGKKIYLKE